MIYALTLASNSQPHNHLVNALKQIASLGCITRSPIYVIPCRDGVGQDYWNAACLLESKQQVNEITNLLKALEKASGRVRPSHDISLDVDLIAWGNTLQNMQFNPKKMPLALDVKIPMFDIWENPLFEHEAHHFPQVSLDGSFSKIR